MPALKIEIIVIPYKCFKEKIRITKRMERKYHIEDFTVDGRYGVLYMERKKPQFENYVTQRGEG